MAGDKMLTVEVKGLAELNAALKQLPQNVARNALRGAANAAAGVIRKEAKARAPVYVPKNVVWGGGSGMPKNHPPPGTLKRAIYSSRVRQLSNDVQQTFHIKVRSAGSDAKVKAGSNRDAFYWRFVEFGTVKMAARPFMRPAFEARKGEAADAVRTYLQQRLPREFAKLGLTYRP